MKTAPNYPTWYDWNDPHNSELLNAMARLRHVACRNEHIFSHARNPGSLEALQAIKSCIDFWAERETGNKEFFWGTPPSGG